jgi:hypothetical protein
MLEAVDFLTDTQHINVFVTKVTAKADVNTKSAEAC